MKTRRLLFAVMMPAMLAAACTSSDRGLREFEPGTGPDEFRVIPQRGLTLPDDLNALPAPTPGGTNAADPNPVADAIVALGGRPGAGSGGDAALLNAVGRNGVDPSIRADLAAADQRFRERRSRFGGVGAQDPYFAAYARQALDAYAELERFRALGVAVPSAPPSE